MISNENKNNKNKNEYGTKVTQKLFSFNANAMFDVYILLLERFVLRLTLCIQFAVILIGNYIKKHEHIRSFVQVEHEKRNM